MYINRIQGNSEGRSAVLRDRQRILEKIEIVAEWMAYHQCGS